MTQFEKRCFIYISAAIGGFLVYHAFSAFIPFLAAFGLAYMLRPIVTKAKSYNISSTLSALTLTLLMYCLLGTVIIVLIPSIKHLALFLFHHISLCKEEVLKRLLDTLQKLHMPAPLIQWTERTLPEALSFTTLKLREVLFYVLQSGWSVAKILGIIAMAPFLSFYMMKDWSKMIQGVIQCIPYAYRNTLLETAQGIHHTFSAYLRGQALVCLTLCGYYSTTLKLSGLRFGWLIGLLIGVFAFIPYVSVFTGIATAFLIALLDFPDVNLKVLSIIFTIGYGMEAFFLTPGFIGKRIGIHPIVVFMAIFLLGNIMGMTGILLSAPLTAVAVACVRMLKRHYLKSFFYTGGRTP
jgi:predicted PurR-regulated permease PerM